MLTIRNIFKLILLVILVFTATKLWAQDDEEFYEQMLTDEVEVENPVYKPVISLGTGMLNFLGDVRNLGQSPIIGQPGYKGMVSTFIGQDNYYRLNFFFLLGSLQGHDFNISRGMQRDVGLLSRDDDGMPIYHNSSFRSDFFELGINLEYGFGHWLGLTRRFRPFVSIGVSPLHVISFNTSTQNSDGSYFYFWGDGTIRNLPETHPDAWQSDIIRFEKTWDSNIPLTNYHQLEKKYSETNVVIPLEVGFDFYLSYRINLRVSTSLHYTFTDLLDNFNLSVAERYGLTDYHNGRNDMFMYTSVSFNFDLFSDPDVIRVDLFFAELEDFDYDVMFADQDMDGVFDRFDECPDTPIGVEVDSVGCPFDSDGDGVPDFMDDEPNTPRGAIVDDRGVQISSEVLAEMFDSPTAVRREEAQVIPVAPIWTRNITFTPGEIPRKFREVDKDGDGYISFQELLMAVEQFFDGTLDMSVEDIYELNNFFFSQ